MINRKLNNIATAICSPLTAHFGLTIDNVDLNASNADEINYYKNLLYKHKVLVFRDVDLSVAKYLAFAKLFGDIVKFVDEDYRHPEHPEIFVVSNIKKDGKNFGKDRVGYYWHSDSSFMADPLPITMLYSQTVPNKGGETAFVDMASVYKKIKHQLPGQAGTLYASHEGKWRYLITNSDVGLSIEEVLKRDEKHVPSQAHPLVLTHPHTKEKSLYFSHGITRKILDVSESDSQRLLSFILENIDNDVSFYKHQWKENEIVIWDNRSVVHRAYPSEAGQNRMMFRIGVNDGKFFI